MKFLAVILTASVLSGCVARSVHVEKGDRITADLAREFALEHPANPRAQDIARRAGKHAEEGAGFDFVGILQQIMASIPGGWPGLVAMILGALGVASPGISIRRKPTPPVTPPASQAQV